MDIGRILFLLVIGIILNLAVGGMVCMWKVIPYPDTLWKAIITAAKWPKYLFRAPPR